MIKEEKEKTQNTMSDALYFYLDEQNLSKHTFSEVIEWDDKRLEKRHDYIEWLFPTDLPPHFNQNAPKIDKKDIEAFKEDIELQLKFKQAEEKMRSFWCLDRLIDIWWARSSNQNLIRIANVIRSIKLISGEERAQKFFAAVEKAAEGKQLGDVILSWKKALSDEPNLG